MRHLGWFLLAILATGCSTPTIYSWGKYEGQVYTMYAHPDKASPELQVVFMEGDYERARSKNQRVPPGFHAHLGYLYTQLGKLDRARQEFETEKAEFPEAAVFMDRLLANLNKP